MSRKRRNTSSPEPDMSPKRQRPIPRNGDEYNYMSAREKEQSRIDAVYGQTGAFPGLDAGDELFYGPANDGIEYLRMVRSEAKDVPLVLSAAISQATIILNKVEEGDPEEGGFYGGFYKDEAYIAPRMDDRATVGLSEISGVQKWYYAALLNRFKRHQAMLRITPPLSMIELLTSAQPISFPVESKAARKQWRNILRTKQPHPTQVACMDADSVLSMVDLMAESMSGVLRGGSANTVRQFGAWAWAVLGRTRDVSELGSEEVAELREMGKKAADLMEHLLGGSEQIGGSEEKGEVQDPKDDSTAICQSTETGGLNITGGEHLALEEVKARLIGEVAQEEPSKGNDGQGRTGRGDERGVEIATVILDMIITIIGEVYGQRDLLRFREVWESTGG